MTDPSDPRGNHLLAALSDAPGQHWWSQLERVELWAGQVLHESGAALGHVYFPTSAVVSLMYAFQDGASAQMAVVGNEGMVGVSLLLGGGSTPSRAVVHGAGVAFRLRAQAVKEEFDRPGSLLQLLLRYTQALIAQMALTAVCNRYHTLDQQLCRWLLLSLDRRVGNELVMTQEQIAHSLGVRREGVTAAALRLQAAGVIHYTRGHITVLERSGLERRSCGCYAAVRNEYARLLPAARPALLRPAIAPAVPAWRPDDQHRSPSPQTETAGAS